VKLVRPAYVVILVPLDRQFRPVEVRRKQRAELPVDAIQAVADPLHLVQQSLHLRRLDGEVAGQGAKPARAQRLEALHLVADHRNLVLDLPGLVCHLRHRVGRGDQALGEPGGIEHRNPRRPGRPADGQGQHQGGGSEQPAHGPPP
jgi:hypothetical protein